MTQILSEEDQHVNNFEPVTLFDEPVCTRGPPTNGRLDAEDIGSPKREPPLDPFLDASVVNAHRFPPLSGLPEISPPQRMSTPHNLFDTRKTFDLGNGTQGLFYSLPALEQAGIGPISRLPVSIRLVLESVLRNCDGLKVQESNVRELANWRPNEPRTAEIPFVVARIVLQDFTGVPLLVDLAAMRTAVAKLGKNPKIIEPLVPVDLVVDHSVQVDFAGTPDAMARNLDLEFSRNRERYQFLKWGMQAFDTFKVVPPGIGIVHQVNLEYLAQGVLHSSPEPGSQTPNPIFYPDTLVGTDSHTT